MNLKRLSNIFGARPPLTREDISTYGSTEDSNVRHAIEQKEASDPFEADAMEGWEAMGYDTSVMSGLDKKFLKTSNWGWYITGTVVVAAVVTTLLVMNTTPKNEGKTVVASNDDKITELLEDQELTYEQTDLVLPDSIEVLIDIPEEHQIAPKKMQKEFEEMKTTYEVQLPPKVEMLPLDQIRITPKVVAPEIIREHNSGVEIYLHDLKLVDYRKYRAKPAVRTKQIVLTGTPANLEGQNSEDETPQMRDVDIPYIEYVSKTMAKFSRGSYKNALTRFDVILSTYETDVNANFYSGLCLFNLGQYEEAIDRFLACTGGPFSNFDEEAQWMTALSYEKLGQTEKARSYFEKIISQGGFYKKQAQAKMK